MKLMTKAIQKAFEKQGYTGELEAKDIKIIAKFFNPCGAATWYLYEKEDDDIYMAFVNLGDAQCAESGRVSLREIENLRLPMGMSVERDRSFVPFSINLQELSDKIKAGGHV